MNYYTEAMDRIVGRGRRKKDLLTELSRAQQALVAFDPDQPDALHHFRLIMDEVLCQFIRDLEE